ncbi:MAG: TorF family putative porin, partial [Planctomycetota bacterium]
TSATAKAVYYWYADADTPAGSPDYDYWEFIAGVSHDYGKIGVSAELAYSPDYFAESGDATALTAGVSAPLMEKFLFFTGGLEASGHVGYQWLDTSDDYLFFDFGFGTSWNQISLDVRWVDTDLDKADCGGTDLCEGGVVVSVSASLP